MKARNNFNFWTKWQWKLTKQVSRTMTTQLFQILTQSPWTFRTSPVYWGKRFCNMTWKKRRCRRPFLICSSERRWFVFPVSQKTFVLPSYRPSPRLTVVCRRAPALFTFQVVILVLLLPNCRPVSPKLIGMVTHVRVRHGCRVMPMTVVYQSCRPKCRRWTPWWRVRGLLAFLFRRSRRVMNVQPWLPCFQLKLRVKIVR